MAVGGAPTRRADHAAAVAEFALAIRQETAARTAPNGDPLHVRIGIHSGSIVAGVIGKRRFIYDQWGDTVNVASRMESHGVPDGIQVTDATYRRLADRYEFDARGPIDVKGKGPMTAFLLIGRKQPTGVREGVVP